MAHKPRLGVFKFASCDGCQLSLLSVEHELLQLATKIEIAYFLEASSRIEPGPYDIALVEGSITTEHDLERIKQVRHDSRYLVTIGACATAGGIQALRNGQDCDEFVAAVYPTPKFISTLSTSTPISEHVPVDFELRGCPISQHQLLEVIRSLLTGRQPRTPSHSVCLDCKRQGNVCITVATGEACLGPVTQAGCNAICPTFSRGCYGCYGPSVQPNLVSLGNQFAKTDTAVANMIGSLNSFNAAAPEFLQESKRLESQNKERQE